MDAEPKQRVEDLLGDDLQRVTNTKWVREYQPFAERGWRIDLALPTIKLAVEVDGRSHGYAKRHVDDCEKRNALVSAGWKCLTYPASRVLTKKRRLRIVEQITRVLCGVNDVDSDCCTLNGE